MVQYPDQRSLIRPYRFPFIKHILSVAFRSVVSRRGSVGFWNRFPEMRRAPESRRMPELGEAASCPGIAVGSRSLESLRRVPELSSGPGVQAASCPGIASDPGVLAASCPGITSDAGVRRGCVSCPVESVGSRSRGP